MIVVVDTNIVFSGILSPNGKICDLLLNSSEAFDFYAPTAIMEELIEHRQKLLKFSGLTEEELMFLIDTMMQKIELVDLQIVKPMVWEKATELTKNVDDFDTPFIALSLQLDSPLWTGDNKLAKGLKNKGIDWVLNTEAIKLIRDDK